MDDEIRDETSDPDAELGAPCLASETWDSELPPDQPPAQPPWNKAISRSRDRLQSRILAWTAMPGLCYLIFSECRFFYLGSGERAEGKLGPPSLFAMLHGRFIAAQGRYDNHWAQLIAASLLFPLAAWRLRAATASAAICGGMMCLLLGGGLTNAWGDYIIHSGLTPLLLLFLLTFEATRLGRERKVAAGLSEDRKGRNTAQVIANLGIATFFSSLAGWYIVVKCGWEGEFMGAFGPRLRAYLAIPCIPMLAALAEATADTVSSEIGQAFGGRPFMLTTLRRVPPGTDGAVTLLGTLAGVAGAAIIAASGATALGTSASECFVAFAGGVCGLFFDSLLGATVERKGWLGNDLVNFLSTAFAAGVSLAAIRFWQDWMLPK